MEKYMWNTADIRPSAYTQQQSFNTMFIVAIDKFNKIYFQCSYDLRTNQCTSTNGQIVDWDNIKYWSFRSDFDQFIVEHVEQQIVGVK